MSKMRHLLPVLFISFSLIAHAQTDFSAKTWSFIENSINKKGNLTDLLATVQQLQAKAMITQQYFNAARCLDYQLQIDDMRSEDTFYFKNSAFIDETLQSAAPAQLQYALHLMQANRLIFFNRRYNKFQKTRYERRDIPVNYAAYTNTMLDSMAQLHFEAAKKIAVTTTVTPIVDALWLSSDALQFLFLPTLFDIAIAEQLNYAKTKYYSRQLLPTRIDKWIKLSPDDFIKSVYAANRQPGKSYKDLQLFEEWLRYQQTNPANYYFIETVLHKYIFDLVKNGFKETEKIYEQYLLQGTYASYNAVKVYSIYQLCLLWNSQSANYFPASDYGWGYNVRANKKNTDYDTAYRYHAVKALQLFNEHKILLDSFVYLKNILFSMEEKIKRTDCKLSISYNNLPNEPFLAGLKFKNTDTLFYKIVRSQIIYKGSKKNNWFINSLLQQPVQKDSFVVLPDMADYNYHNVFIRIDGMDPGSYGILFSSHQLQDTTVQRSYAFFKVTGIAILNNDQRIYVLNRKTGQPLAGALAEAWYTEKVTKDSGAIFKEHHKKYMVNKAGFFTVPRKEYENIQVVYGKDTVSEDITIRKQEKQEDVYSKDEDDNLLDFYIDHASACVYTDRSIYRPGQTVFYKAIFFTKNKNTGEPMLMSRGNLTGRLFENVYKKLLKEEEPLLMITDPFNKTMDSLKVKPNEFGSVSGSFKIPVTAATGEWEIAPDYIDLEDRTGIFKVEEYKRPSYEITVDKPKREINAGDSFPVTIKVRSFAGAPLNNVKINYSITRNGSFDEYDVSLMDTVTKSGNETIIDTSSYTNNNGELKIIVYDTAVLKKIQSSKNDWHMAYNINAAAIDATGESYEKTANIQLAAKPVNIRIVMVTKYNRSDLYSIPVTTTDKNAGEVDKKISIKIFRLANATTLFNNRKYTKADTWIYDTTVLQSQFPFDNLLNEEVAEIKEFVYEKMVRTGEKEKFLLDEKLLTAGNYKLEASCSEAGKITGETEKYFTIFDANENKLPEATWSFTQLRFNDAAPGDTLKYYYGNSYGPTYSIFHIAYFAGKKKVDNRYFYDERNDAKGISQFKLAIPHNAASEVKLTHLYILNNQLFAKTETIYITKTATQQPEIIIEKYRKQLTPGSKETFTVSIKTKNDNTAAELMTTMYDASLDKIEPHEWRKPDNYSNIRLQLDWENNINYDVNSDNELLNSTQAYFPGRKKTAPLWWLNALDYAYDDYILGDWNAETPLRYSFQHDMNPDIRYNAGEMLQGRVPGLTIGRTQGLDDVVVIGYGSVVRSKDLAGSISGIRIRSTSASLLSYNQPLIILDGKKYEGDLGKIDAATITDGLVLKGADAAVIYGAGAANGVLLLSTKGPIILPQTPEPVMISRKNFNETAFFFPAIHADRDGYYTFSFTMPETVTEWNWKLLAHTKNAAFMYTERKLNTQLPLMVQPNMPRLLYQGDKIILQSRITNLDTSIATGKIICKIEDALTGKDITAQLILVAQNNFTVNAKQNIAAAFSLTIPATQLNPVKISITVRSQNFADGEEHTIPILNSKVFVRENTPYYLVAQKDTSISLPALPADAVGFGMGVSVQSKPQAALLYSLPALADYLYNCAEQTFNKILAYTTAYKLVRTDKATQQSFNAAKQFVEKESTTVKRLPDELQQESMPWLHLANQTAAQQKQLFNLLDTAQSGEMITSLVNRLEKLQNTDGGISWFDGGKSNAYISNYILKGLGKLYTDKQLFPKAVFEDNNYRQFLNKLVAYADVDFLAAVKQKEMDNGFYYAYCRSYLLPAYPLADSVAKRIHNYLSVQWKKENIPAINNRWLYNQAVFIIASLKYAYNQQDSLYINAAAQLRSIEQLAIKDAQHGVRWKQLADDDDLTNSAEETIALLAEAFDLTKNNTINKGMITWLLTAKNEYSWSSTKGTAAAVNLLANENNTVTGETQTVKMTINKEILKVSNDLLNGHTFNYLPVNNLPATLQMQKDNDAPVSGNLYRYYFTSPGNAVLLNREVQLTRQWYKLNNSGWEIISPHTILKIADKIKVVITTQSARSLQYVFINDKRAASLEPVDNSSGTGYADGLYYYQSVRDAGSQFFIDFIPSGKHSITYEMKVTQEGVFSNGVAQLQCMYRPDITAYSDTFNYQVRTINE